MTDRDDELASLESRIRRLEDVAFEGDGLTRSVSRLGHSASALGEALLQVDRNQQALTQLGSQLRSVEEHALTREEAEAREGEQTKARRKLVAVTLIPSVVFLFTVAFGVSQAGYQACERRHEASRANIEVLMALKTGRPQDDLRIQRGIDKIKATLDVPCEDQFVLHVP